MSLRNVDVLHRFLFIPFCLTVLVTGCSFSASSKSSSDSSRSISDLASSPLTSSSNSSLTERDRYERDIRDYTAEFVASSRGDMESFRVRVGQLAEKHGVTNWEEDRTTYLAIGRGLRKADVSKPQYEAFRNAFSHSDLAKMRYIDQGYR